MNKRIATGLALLVLAPSSVLAAGQDKNKKDITFANGVLPILKEHCFKCHDSGSKKAGLDVSTYETLMEGNSAGKVVAAGAPDKSKLYAMVTGAKPKMPKNAPQLEKSQTDVLAAWIKAGAKNN